MPNNTATKTRNESINKKIIENIVNDIHIPLVPKNYNECSVNLSEKEARIINSANNYIQQEQTTILSLTPDVSEVAKKITEIRGLSDVETTLIIDSFDLTNIPKNKKSYEYVLPDEAATAIEKLFNKKQNTYYSTKLSQLVNSIRKANYTLTRFDLQCLTYFNNYIIEILENFSLPARRSVSDQWIPCIIDRNCTLCGNHIDSRETHGFLVNNTETKPDKTSIAQNPLNEFCAHYSSVNYNKTASAISAGSSAGYSYETTKRNIVTLSDYLPLLDVSTLVLHNLDAKKVFTQNISLNNLEDSYMASPILRKAIISLFIQPLDGSRKPDSFGLEIPPQIREAILASPPVALTESITQGENNTYASTLMLILAAKINPCFTKTEVTRMIQSGDHSVLAALLATKKTRNFALQSIGETAYDSTKTLAAKPEGISETETAMLAQSRNPHVRAIAAGSSCLSASEALMLAKDPSEFVRKSLANTRLLGAVVTPTSAATEKYPEVARLLVNDPEFSVARMVFESVRSDSFIKGQPVNDYSKLENFIHQTAEQESYSYKTRKTRNQHNNKIQGFSFQQKDLIAHIRTRKRLNELKKHVIANPAKYPLKNPSVLKFLTY